MSAQKIGLEASFYTGKVWRHTPKLTTKTGNLLTGEELGILFQTTGRREWQAWQRFPVLGFSIGQFDFGEGSHGRAFAFWPHISLPLLRKETWGLYFRVGTGFAWVTQPYDYFKNPTQNAIGSHLNNITQFRLSGLVNAGPRLRLSAGGNMTHFSNGSAALPNFGINIFSGWMGAQYFFHPIQKADFVAAVDGKRKVKHRWGAQIQGSFAKVEFASYDGPRYAIWGGSSAGYFQFSQTNRISAGLNYEYNHAIFEWGLHSARFENEAAARRGATRVDFFVAEEFLFGDIGMHVQAGQYWGKEINQYVPKPRYAKLSIRYYFPEIFGTRLKWFSGISIKAHKFTAEYISLSSGLSF